MHKCIRTKKNNIIINKKRLNKRLNNTCNNLSNNLTNKTLNGGRFLGEGSFGCVVTPAIPCYVKKGNSSKSSISNTSNTSNTSNKSNKKYNSKKIDKTVSKIIISPSEDDKEEITISNKLKKIDTKKQFFITFDDACYIKKIPNDRSNTARVEYNDDTRETYDILDNKKYDKEYCPIDLSLKPINLIMPYGGYDLLTVTNKKNNNPEIIFIRKLLFQNFKACFKNLLNGIQLMHSYRIVNRDIKKDNIMINYIPKDTKDTKDQKNAPGKLDIKYIDFGLSSILTPLYCQKMHNIDIRGSEHYISPELIISFYIFDNRGFDKIKNTINKEIKTKLISLKNSNLIINFDNSIIELHNNIKQEFKDKKILERFFGTDKEKEKYNGYLQKGDIFALGVTIYELLNYYKYELKYEINNYDKLVNLLEKMVRLNPDNRYNVQQCLFHPYFI